MANQWYPKANNHIGAGLNLTTANKLKFALVTSGYTFSTASEFVTDLGANIVARTAYLTSVTLGTVGPGILDAADSVFTALTGSVGTQLVLLYDTGSDATSPVLLQMDNTDCAGLPVTPTGADVPLTFNAGGIAQI